MRKLILAAAALGTLGLFAAPASAQWNRGYGYGHGYGDREVRQELRECRRELRLAETRWEYRRELRECRRELREARRDSWRDGYDYRPRGYGYYRPYRAPYHGRYYRY